MNNVPLWKDWDPRFGAAYDLCGDGKTAIKVALGRYVGEEQHQFTLANNPITTSVNTVTRTWTDTNGNYVPDCNLALLPGQRRVRRGQQPELRGNQPHHHYADDVDQAAPATAATTGISRPKCSASSIPGCR